MHVRRQARDRGTEHIVTIHILHILKPQHGIHGSLICVFGPLEQTWLGHVFRGTTHRQHHDHGSKRMRKIYVRKNQDGNSNRPKADTDGSFFQFVTTMARKM